MILATLKTGLCALGTLCLLGCRPTQTAFFHSTAPAVWPAQDPLPIEPTAETDSLPATALMNPSSAVASGAASQEVAEPGGQARHANPDAQPARRRTWLNQKVLFAPSGETYTAQRLPIDVPAKRVVPKGAVYALAGSTLPYGLLLINSLPAWAWWLSLSLPVASLFLATGAMTKIRRNKAQYRGKGWTIAAMLLATSYMGMVLVAVAALASSGILWE